MRVALLVGDAQRVDVGDRVVDDARPAQRRVGAEQHVVGAEELGRAPDRVRRPEHRAVGVEAPEVLDRRQRQPGRHLVPVVRPRSGRQPPGEVRHHRAGVMRDDLQARVAVEVAGVDEPRHAHRRLVRPAERPPDAVPRPVLLGIVAPGVAARGVHPDRPVERRPCARTAARSAARRAAFPARSCAPGCRGRRARRWRGRSPRAPRRRRSAGPRPRSRRSDPGAPQPVRPARRSPRGRGRATAPGRRAPRAAGPPGSAPAGSRGTARGTATARPGR